VSAIDRVCFYTQKEVLDSMAKKKVSRKPNAERNLYDERHSEEKKKSDINDDETDDVYM